MYVCVCVYVCEYTQNTQKNIYNLPLQKVPITLFTLPCNSEYFCRLKTLAESGSVAIPFSSNRLFPSSIPTVIMWIPAMRA